MFRMKRSGLQLSRWWGSSAVWFMQESMWLGVRRSGVQPAHTGASLNIWKHHNLRLELAGTAPWPPQHLFSPWTSHNQANRLKFGTSGVPVEQRWCFYLGKKCPVSDQCSIYHQASLWFCHVVIPSCSESQRLSLLQFLKWAGNMGWWMVLKSLSTLSTTFPPTFA